MKLKAYSDMIYPFNQSIYWIFLIFMFPFIIDRKEKNAKKEIFIQNYQNVDPPILQRYSNLSSWGSEQEVFLMKSLFIGDNQENET
jgi:hypothetical protein